MAKYTITLFEGDGIGPEITASLKKVFSALKVDIDYEDYYNMVIQDKININRCISQNYENLFYKYQIII